MLKNFPAFEGELFVEGAPIEEASEDFGHLSQQKPGAILRPASSEDVAKLLRFASKNNIRVTTRGLGHSMGGQALIEGGVVIDSRGLSQVRSLDASGVWAESGLTWADLNRYTISKDVIVPSLTDHSRLSVGGVLSVGGISGQAFRFGSQVETVLALEVVTSLGEIIQCSPEHERDLFESCLGGLGQFGIITAAKLKLVAAQDRVRTYEALYPNPDVFLDLQMRLCHQDQFDYVAGLAVPTPTNTWGFLVQASKFYQRGDAPDDAEYLKLLEPKPLQVATHDRSLTEFLDRGDEQEKMLKEAGIWGAPHPWLTQFFPRESSLEFFASLASQLSPSDIGFGLLASYPLVLPKPSQAPFFCMPDAKEKFLIGILSSVLPPTKEQTQKLVEHKRALYAQGRKLGAKLYPVGLLPKQGEWPEHYGEKWESFQERKRRFDPTMSLGFELGNR